MAKAQMSMGKEYRFSAEGEWDQISEVARAMKEIVGNTRQEQIFSMGPDMNLEGRLLRAYLTPQEDDASFEDYRDRFVHAFLGTGLKSKLAKLIMRKKVPMNLSMNEDGDILSIALRTKGTQFSAVIGASGDYSERGEEIVKNLGEFCEKNSISYTCNDAERLIKY